MWPKALGQLVELAPHITRLLPMADRYFKDKATGDDTLRQLLDQQRTLAESQRAAATDLSDRLHADLGAVTSAQATQGATLQRQISDLEQQLKSTLTHAVSDRQVTQGLEARLQRLEAGQATQRTLLLVAVALLALVLIFVAILLFHSR